MRKTLLLAVLAVSAAAQAQVNPIGPFFTPWFMQDDLNAIAPGSYSFAPLFSAPVSGTAWALNPPAMLDIGPPPFFQPAAYSAPNTMLGNGTDIGIRVAPNMRRFGAWFRNCPNSAGVAPNFAKIAFFDNSGAFIGSAGIPLTNTWTWYGWATVLPQRYSWVEIYSSAGPGGVEMDDISVRFN